MKPTDLPLLRSAGRPLLLPDGRVLVTVSHPDLDNDRNDSRLVLLDAENGQRDFTTGPKDSGPVLSPDSKTVAFLRAGESGPSQLHVIRLDGGEARRITDHKLGVSDPVFSPDGSWIAYLAAVAQHGRYGTDEKISSEAEAPRRITSMSYRVDGKGFTLDKPDQIFLVPTDHVLVDDAHSDDDPDPSASRPKALTAEPRGAGRPAFSADGTTIVYPRSIGADDITSELVTIAVPAGDSDEPPTPDVLVTGIGNVGPALIDGDTVYFGAEAFTGVDFCGQLPGLWSIPLVGGSPRRMTDEQTVYVEGIDPVVTADRVLIAVQHRGAVELRAVPKDADQVVLDELPVLLGGQRVVKAFDYVGDAAAGRLTAVIGDPTSFAEVVLADVDPAAGTSTNERVLTDLGGELKTAGIGDVVELTGQSPDGHPVHGWLVLPPGPGPHPVLLNVHGGPYSAYSWSLFDEAQVYASAGYAVVMGNPRGSSGYGRDHGRAIVKAIGTVDAVDVLALLDLALERDDLQSDRVGVMGGSYGGFMTSWLASQAPGRFVAGISERALNAWDSFAGSSDIGYFFAEAYVGADRDSQWQASALAHADSIDIPMMIIHSEQDWRCPVEQGQRLFTALRLRGVEAEMLLFPAEGHELSRGGRPRHRQQRFEAILDWWQRHLPV